MVGLAVSLPGPVGAAVPLVSGVIVGDTVVLVPPVGELVGASVEDATGGNVKAPPAVVGEAVCGVVGEAVCGVVGASVCCMLGDSVCCIDGATDSVTWMVGSKVGPIGAGRNVGISAREGACDGAKGSTTFNVS